MGEYKKTYNIPLTEGKLYKVTLPLGQGSLSIGTKGVSKGTYDIWIEKDYDINWDAFNGLFTGYGQANREQFPYGDWPRFFYYSGNDQGFVDWSYKRSIEEFHWFPQTDAAVDLTKANIRHLFIHAEKNTIQISTGDQLRSLTCSGCIKNIELKACAEIPHITFFLNDPQAEKLCYHLPVYDVLKEAASVHIENSPVGLAFDCAGLLQFPNLTNLNLNGNLTNLSALAELKNLERIGLRFVPDLQDMPKLAAWNGLKSFIGYNIEETSGKELRAELKKLLKEKEMDYSGVTKLRKKIWFTTEYGIPFSGWEDKNAKMAARAYKACWNEVKRSKAEKEVQEAIVKFVEIINGLEGIETSEREDVGDAIGQFADACSLEIAKEKWQLWFDEVRDF